MQVEQGKKRRKNCKIFAVYAIWVHNDFLLFATPYMKILDLKGCLWILFLIPEFDLILCCELVLNITVISDAVNQIVVRIYWIQMLKYVKEQKWCVKECWHRESSCRRGGK